MRSIPARRLLGGSLAWTLICAVGALPVQAEPAASAVSDSRATRETEAASFYKLAADLLEQGRKRDAKKVLERLVKDYPGTTAATQASSWLANPSATLPPAPGTHTTSGPPAAPAATSAPAGSRRAASSTSPPASGVAGGSSGAAGTTSGEARTVPAAAEARSFYVLAADLVKQGRRRDAKKVLERLVRDYPGTPSARLAEAWLANPSKPLPPPPPADPAPAPAATYTAPTTPATPPGSSATSPAAGTEASPVASEAPASAPANPTEATTPASAVVTPQASTPAGTGAAAPAGTGSTTSGAEPAPTNAAPAGTDPAATAPSAGAGATSNGSVATPAGAGATAAVSPAPDPSSPSLAPVPHEIQARAYYLLAVDLLQDGETEAARPLLIRIARQYANTAYATLALNRLSELELTERVELPDAGGPDEEEEFGGEAGGAAGMGTGGTGAGRMGAAGASSPGSSRGLLIRRRTGWGVSLNPFALLSGGDTAAGLFPAHLVVPIALNPRLRLEPTLGFAAFNPEGRNDSAGRAFYLGASLYRLWSLDRSTLAYLGPRVGLTHASIGTDDDNSATSVTLGLAIGGELLVTPHLSLGLEFHESYLIGPTGEDGLRSALSPGAQIFMRWYFDARRDTR